MVNKFKEINWRPNCAERKKFALTLMAGFPCMAVGLSIILRVATGRWDFQLPALVVGLGEAVALISWLVPAWALPVYRLWYFAICVVDTVVTLLVLTVLFYGVILPAGLLYRLFRGATFPKKPSPSAVSYWQEVAPATAVVRYYRQY